MAAGRREFLHKTGYPLLAEPLSQLRVNFNDVAVLEHHDHLLRSFMVPQVAPKL